jgi:hypothetical protein
LGGVKVLFDQRDEAMGRRVIADRERAGVEPALCSFPKGRAKSKPCLLHCLLLNQE